MSPLEELKNILLTLDLLSEGEMESYEEQAKADQKSLWQILKDAKKISQGTYDTLTIASKGYMPIHAARIAITMKEQDVKQQRNRASSSTTGLRTTRKSQVAIEKPSEFSGLLSKSALPPSPPKKKPREPSPEAPPKVSSSPVALDSAKAETSRDDIQQPARLPSDSAIPPSKSGPSLDDARALYRALEGVELGKYRFITQLGRGASGKVLLGHHNLLGLPVAIKVLDPTLAVLKPDHVKRFFFEARTAARINHPNLIRVLDCGEESGLNMIVMEYAEGITISEFLQINGTIAEKRALSLIHGVAQGLESAFSQGIIHRDVKPANIILTKNQQVKLADLGLAKNLNSEVNNDTAQDVGLGTPYYFSPEQAESAAKADHRADIYSLGITLYHMIAGRVPFQGTSISEIIYKHHHEKAKPLRELGHNVSQETEALIERMIAKNVDDRYADYPELINGINEAIAAADQLSENPESYKRPKSLVSRLWKSFTN